ncbi:MAG: Gfo/Idh/MocA family oxidoreductase [Planctomycetales bacterium]|nr:Gfo/Idh/MocA family oxidoreductase [Planctomycetales bacterium]
MPGRNRRSFIQQSTAWGAGLGLAAHASGRAMAANEKISVACIGVRGRGNSVMHSFAAEPDCAITHICDVREAVRNQRGAEIKDKTGHMPKLVNDYRSLLNDPSIDAFMVATPDHWHALLTIEGCMAGKDVYVEKPASHNILEGKTAVAAARKHERMVQMGTQIRSAPFLRQARAYIDSGAMGKVIYGKAWETDRNPSVHLSADSAPPKGIDYDIWQGPAPERPYNATIVGGAWRWLFDYGTGDLGNDGVHRIDYCRYLMGLDEMPEAVCCSGGKFFFEDDQQWPDTMLVNYEYPGKVLQYEMRLWSMPKLFDATEGAVVYGENGWMLVTNTSWKAYDADGKLAQQGNSDVGQQAHVRNFLDAVRSRRRESLNQEIYSGHVSTVMCHAGNISFRTGKKLRLDAQTELFDDEQANQLVGREHRKGYELPTIA